MLYIPCAASCTCCINSPFCREKNRKISLHETKIRSLSEESSNLKSKWFFLAVIPFWLQFIIQLVGNYEDYMYILKVPSKTFSHGDQFQSWQKAMLRSCVLGPTYTWWIWTAWVRVSDCSHSNVTHSEILSPDPCWASAIMRWQEGYKPAPSRTSGQEHR